MLPAAQPCLVATLCNQEVLPASHMHSGVHCTNFHLNGVLFGLFWSNELVPFLSILVFVSVTGQMHLEIKLVMCGKLKR